MSNEAEVNHLTEALKEVNISETTKVGKTRPAKAEKPAKQPPPPPPEDHAKDRYGKLAVNFGRIQHSGTQVDTHLTITWFRVGLDGDGDAR